MDSSTNIKNTQQLDLTQGDVIRTLLYFDIFDYPLSKEEIKKFMPSRHNGKFEQQFEALLESKYINKIGEQFYGTSQDQSIADRRIKGNALAAKKMKAAKRMSRLISYFPYVRCIMLSGSLSKEYMQADSDVDFFIITAPKRLWIARTLLVLFKRLFLFNSRKFFCVNYFIDADNMEIEEKNLFTAIESATLIPTYGKDYYKDYWRSNQWVSEYLPNSPMRTTADVPPSKRYLFTWLGEKLIPDFIGDYLDKRLMSITLKHWKSRYSKELNIEDFDIAFKTSRGVSKCHPQFFQKKVLETLDRKIEDFERIKSVKLSD